MPFYAVKVGRKPGIYNSWKECQEQINGFSKASFHKFNTIEECESFLATPVSGINRINDIASNKEIDDNIQFPCGFIDGSCIKDKVVSYGGFICLDNFDDKIIIQGQVTDKDKKRSMNIAGELCGCIELIKKAIELKIEELNIYYDYVGIELFATGEWNSGVLVAKDYKMFIDSVKNKIKLNFIKVAAHVGIDGNEIADTLAKEALKL